MLFLRRNACSRRVGMSRISLTTYACGGRKSTLTFFATYIHDAHQRSDAVALERGLKWHLVLHDILLRGPKDERGTRGRGVSVVNTVLGARFARWEKGELDELISELIRDRQHCRQKQQHRAQERDEETARVVRFERVIQLVNDGEVSVGLCCQADEEEVTWCGRHRGVVLAHVATTGALGATQGGGERVERRSGTSLRCGYLVPVHTRAVVPRGRSRGALGGIRAPAPESCLGFESRTPRKGKGLMKWTGALALGAWSGHTHISQHTRTKIEV